MALRFDGTKFVPDHPIEPETTAPVYEGTVGLDIRPCEYAATVAVTDLTSLAGIDTGGATPTAGDRALFHVTGSGAFIGIYRWTGAAWTNVPTRFPEGTTIKILRGYAGPRVYQQTAATGAATPVFEPIVPGMVAVTGDMLHNSPGSLLLPESELRLSLSGPSITLDIDWDPAESDGSEIACSIDGAAWVYLSPDDGNIQTISTTNRRHDLVIRNGCAAALYFPTSPTGDGNSLRFSRVRAIGSVSALRISGKARPAKRLVVCGDSISQGMGATHPNTEGWAKWLEAQHPGAIAVALPGGGYMSVRWQAVIDPTFANTARIVADCCDGVENTIVVALGINDYTNATYATPALWAADLLKLIAAIHTAAPTARIYYQSPILYGTEGTLPDWRAAALSATANLSPSWFTFVHGGTQIAINPASGLHPNTAEYITMGKCWESILGLWSLVDLVQSTGRADTAGYVALRENVDSTTVSRWRDSTEHGHDLTTNIAAKRPRWTRDGTLAGRDFVRGTNADACRLSSNTWSWLVDAGHQWHRLILFRCTAAGANYRNIIDGYTLNANSIFQTVSDNLVVYAGGSMVEIIAAPVGTGWHLIHQWQQYTVERTKVDGTYTSQTTVGEVNPDGITLFCSANDANPGNVDIAEVAVVPVPGGGDFSAAMYTRLHLHLTALGIANAYS